LLILFGCWVVSLPLNASNTRIENNLVDYAVNWTITLKAGDDFAQVKLEIENGKPVKEVTFNFDVARFSDFKANGKYKIENEQLRWRPSKTDARLTYKVRITRERESKNKIGELSNISYDALMTNNWALFRADRVIPSMQVRTRKGYRSRAHLKFVLPKGWTVNTGWPIESGATFRNYYRIDDPDRNFDRPTGWVIAGILGTRRDKFLDTSYVSVSAPQDSTVDRMGILALIGLTYPEIKRAFGTVPSKFLIVSGDDPLWRGGLSGPNSLYFHSSRRAISENGTSPLLHEITHLVTRISGAERDDWIAEGIAEFYGIELLYRSGGISEAKRTQILQRLAQWGKSVHSLRHKQSTGPVTARAVLLFNDLDKEIKLNSKGRYSLDDLIQKLMEKRRISLAYLRTAYSDLVGQESLVLQNKLLNLGL
jgi:hypothetical protein